MPVEEIPGFCPLCRSRCGATFEVDDDRLLRARAASDHPTGHAFCLKGKAAPELVDQPNRILYPLRRTAPKTAADPGWQRISWEEALAEVAARLAEIRDQSGPEAVAFSVTTPSGTPISDSIDWIERFIRIFGSPNTCYATEICNWHKDHAHKFTYGTGLPYPDYAHTDAVLLWGFNPSATWPDQAASVAEARKRGAKVIVVDPRRAGLAARADHWLRVKPGTDGVLALALANLLLKDEAFDREFIQRWSNGPFLVRDDTGAFLRERDIDSHEGERYVVWDDALRAPLFFDRDDGSFDREPGNLRLRGAVEVPTRTGALSCTPAFEIFARACEEFRVERAAEITAIPDDEIRAVAETLKQARTVSYYVWSGVGQHTNATQTDRAIALLMALKGGYDAPGGNVLFSQHPRNVVNGFDLFPPGQLEKALGRTERPLGPPSQGWVLARDVCTAVLEGEPYRVRALLGFGGNMILSHADPGHARAALQELEFHVHCDVVETPTARFADILLPINTPWEREGLRVGFEVSQEAEELIQLRPQLIAPRGESRSDTEIVFDLAVRLGLGEHFFDGDIEAAQSHRLAPAGVTLEMLRAQPAGVRRPLRTGYRKYMEKDGGKPRGFPTETGRVEIYSELFLRHGTAPVPRFDAPSESRPEQEDDYPFLLTSAKSSYYCHSQHRGLAGLRSREPDPVVELCGEAAEACDLCDGDWVEIESAYGKTTMRLRINPSLHPRVAVAAYGWWEGNPALGQPGYDPLSDHGANYNRLVSAREVDVISGSVPHRQVRCRLRPARRPAPASSRRLPITDGE